MEILGVSQEVTVPETAFAATSGPGPPRTSANEIEPDIPGRAKAKMEYPEFSTLVITYWQLISFLIFKNYLSVLQRS